MNANTPPGDRLFVLLTRYQFLFKNMLKNMVFKKARTRMKGAHR